MKFHVFHIADQVVMGGLGEFLCGDANALDGQEVRRTIAPAILRGERFLAMDNMDREVGSAEQESQQVIEAAEVVGPERDYPLVGFVCESRVLVLIS